MIIKIGRKECKIHVNAYILDNGSCWQLFAGLGRDFGYSNSNREFIRSIRMPKSVLAKIDLSKLLKIEREKLTYYYFTSENL
jgi:hypothetical protein